MIEDHVGMSCVWIACCMIEKISKDCKIELCGLLAHSTVCDRWSLLMRLITQYILARGDGPGLECYTCTRRDSHMGEEPRI